MGGKDSCKFEFYIYRTVFLGLQIPNSLVSDCKSETAGLSFIFIEPFFGITNPGQFGFGLQIRNGGEVGCPPKAEITVRCAGDALETI